MHDTLISPSPTVRATYERQRRAHPSTNDREEEGLAGGCQMPTIIFTARKVRRPPYTVGLSAARHEKTYKRLSFFYKGKEGGGLGTCARFFHFGTASGPRAGDAVVMVQPPNGLRDTARLSGSPRAASRRKTPELNFLRAVKCDDGHRDTVSWEATAGLSGSLCSLLRLRQSFSCLSDRATGKALCGFFFRWALRCLRESTVFGRNYVFIPLCVSGVLACMYMMPLVKCQWMGRTIFSF